MNEQIKVLDHGYIQLIESWGSDERIIESARMSTDGAFRGWGKREQCQYCGLSVDEMANTPAWMECPASGTAHSMGPYGPPGDEKLLRYLWMNHHTTPFEMCGLTIEVQAPIFVFRQWQRHRTQSYNELSARYTKLPDLFYVPTLERITESVQSSNNRQAGGLGELTVAASTVQRKIATSCEAAFDDYHLLLLAGISKELARTVLPVGAYSRMRASVNLLNCLKFLTLRHDPHAQWEIRQYACELDKIIQSLFPRTHEVFSAAGS